MSSPVDEIIAAATRGDLEQITGLLARDPSLADAANLLGSTALHAAYYSGHYRAIGLLLYKGRALDGFLAAELGLLGPLGGAHARQTAAETAAAQGQTDAAELLRSAGG